MLYVIVCCRLRPISQDGRCKVRLWEGRRLEGAAVLRCHACKPPLMSLLPCPPPFQFQFQVTPSHINKVWQPGPQTVCELAPPTSPTAGLARVVLCIAWETWINPLLSLSSEGIMFGGMWLCLSPPPHPRAHIRCAHACTHVLHPMRA